MTVRQLKTSDKVPCKHKHAWIMQLYFNEKYIYKLDIKYGCIETNIGSTNLILTVLYYTP